MDVDVEALERILNSDVTVQEVLDILFEGNSNVPEADAVYIAPPDPAVLTDEDSGDEDEGGNPDNLNARQLCAQAEVRLADKEIEPEPRNLDYLSWNKQQQWIDGELSSNLVALRNCHVPKHCNQSPVQLFEMFFDNELIQLLVDESNRYAVFKNCPNPRITCEEMRCFFGILILSSYNNLPNKRLYWDSNADTRNEFVCNSMRRNRFELILRFLHCNDNTKLDGKDKMWKIRPVIENIRHKCNKYFVPKQQLAYDESMIKYFGRHSCKQFIRGKPIRFGYKAWCLCTVSGYLVNFSFYQGKSPNANSLYDKEFGKATSPLIHMIDDFSTDVKRLPFHFFFDNLFTGFNLLSFLREEGYGGTGTIRENRIPKSCPLPPNKNLQKEKRGHFLNSICKDDGIIVVKWVDNSVVAVASTCAGVGPVSSVKRYSAKEKKSVQIQRPHTIAEYNRYMGGVDRMDENIAMYRINIRNKKWYWALLSWLIDVSIHNAWQLKKEDGVKMSQLDFRRYIVQFYLTRYMNPVKCAGRPSTSPLATYKARVPDDLRFDGYRHYIKKIEKKRRCAGVNCSSKSSAVRTKCGKCDIGLCLECFEDYHTRE